MMMTTMMMIPRQQAAVAAVTVTVIASEKRNTNPKRVAKSTKRSERKKMTMTAKRAMAVTTGLAASLQLAQDRTTVIDWLID